ncbi:hypothetical protein ESCO_000541 [Escovopsis weberi]|uniref:Uncharacterized protein n=1 Tax=Escovopsis weberi TaxID=150374 RepID=A0A0M8MXR1_ESCWE|nr:hypothetical protein ESCO_000541 [Escovopsis weberi]
MAGERIPTKQPRRLALKPPPPKLVLESETPAKTAKPEARSAMSATSSPSDPDVLRLDTSAVPQPFLDPSYLEN